ncbi:hypothetical protein [Arcobacter sp. CECT 8985]|uniref:hypothetical protein n=1 Tax=Arcobacter sp. CECT 8985 TaxID=1935424 RepID=UPI00100A2452|nr:hypothetical protein [Arcobacter sp. CECT 8985]RXJ84279.1 hypothetical protein CRU93_12700 [Arcobacter sp. CECT 8985]
MQTEEKNKKIAWNKIKYNFDRISSNHAKDWQLALFWIVLFELFSSIFEYEFVNKSHEYVSFIPSGFYKEILIAGLILPFIWLCVYNLVYMYKTNLIYLALYATVGIYLIVTEDVTFNLLLHNLNPFELNIGGTIYFIIQLFFKLIIAYLIYKLVVAFRHQKL